MLSILQKFFLTDSVLPQEFKAFWPGSEIEFDRDSRRAMNEGCAWNVIIFTFGLLEILMCIIRASCVRLYEYKFRSIIAGATFGVLFPMGLSVILIILHQFLLEAMATWGFILGLDANLK